MKKAIIVLLALAASSAMVFAQAAGTTAATTPAATTAPGQPAAVGAPDATKIGVDTAQQKLKEVNIDQFEAAGFWHASIATDEGIVTDRLFEGRPAGSAAEPLPDPRYVGVAPDVVNKYVLGVRTDFYRRGYNEIDITASRPIPIEGIAKTISVWVAGRNYNHVLAIVLQDYFGNTYDLTMGKLNFQGWKKLTVAVPPQNPDGRTGIVQTNFHFTNRSGIKVVGFKILCNPDEDYGTYYIYFDDMRAVTDLFAEDSRDPDDMPDSW
ncbi:MAG TPA: flagellar filament outer layer protein FlaA [Rectinemataceae bacterium]|nr:flagellar filament outer layer protein FlaA [Rectinemataceae bacterium]